MGSPLGRNPQNPVSFPGHTYAAQTAIARTSRRFLSRTNKDSFIHLPTLDCAPRLGSRTPPAAVEGTGPDPAPSTHTHFANVGSGYVLTRLFDAGQSEQDCSSNGGHVPLENFLAVVGIELF
jgi:hypothetical protein